jgi:hypothetical protein
LNINPKKHQTPLQKNMKPEATLVAAFAVLGLAQLRTMAENIPSKPEQLHLRLNLLTAVV